MRRGHVKTEGDYPVQRRLRSAPLPPQVALSQNRVWTHDFNATITAWSNASTFTSARSPDVILDAGSNLTGLRDISFTGNTLVVTQQRLGFGQVNLYTNASAISANLAPTQAITNAAVAVGVDRSVLGSDGTLYVMDSDGVAIFSNATTAPTLKVNLASGGFTSDILLIE